LWCKLKSQHQNLHHGELSAMQADLSLVNGRVVNVFSGEILPQAVAVAGGRIIHVGDESDIDASQAQVIDLGGDFLLPGFFDAHTHCDLFLNPYSYANQVVTSGTTGFFNDGHDLANALGVEPFLAVMAELAQSLVSVYTGVPSASPPYPGVEGRELWTDQDVAQAFQHDNVLGLSELSPYIRLLKGDSSLSRRVRLARSLGRTVEGHTTGCSPAKLNVMAREGVTSCHESLSAEDVIHRVRLGFATMIRQGSIRTELGRAAEAVRRLQGFDASRLMLVSDGMFPEHLLERGNMDWVVTQAVEHGIEPLRAIQMATINPARYFRLDHLLGCIAPGRLAHLLVTHSLERPTPRLVLAKGEVVAEEGNLLRPVAGQASSGLGTRPFTLQPPTADDFRIAQRANASEVPVIRVVDQTVTTREDLALPVAEGYYRPQGEVSALVIISRDGSRRGQGFVKGFCPNLGGLAASIAHETHGLMATGQSPLDMARAMEEVLAMQGGVVLVQDGEIRARVPLALGGICSLKSVQEVAAEMRGLHQALWDLGCKLPYPMWTFGFLSFTSVLALRITYEGVYDVKRGEIVF
jgi:adenine deaminase